MNKHLMLKKETLEKLKSILRKIHRGASANEFKPELKKILSSIKPWEIALLEQELMKEGISPFDIAAVCEIHVDLFRDLIVKDKELLKIPPGHPLHTLLEENNEIVIDSEKLTLYANALRQKRQEAIDELRKILLELLSIKKHFMKLQMLIFPYLERKEITAIPRVLWTKEDQIVHQIKEALGLLNDYVEGKANLEDLREHLLNLSKALVDEVFRENNILFPTLKVLLTDNEWLAIKLEEDIIGHYKVTPKGEWKPHVKPVYPYELDEEISEEQLRKLPEEVRNIILYLRGELAEPSALPEELEAMKRKLKEIGDEAKQYIRHGDVELKEGYLSKEEINAIFNTLPFEITFVDKNNRLRYYNVPKERFFTRTKTAWNRPVGFCHPPRSVHLVRKIIEEFRNGKRDVAEFWINMKGRLIHIRYFPVRSEKGEYLGALEIVQDITDIKKIEGEKRLLD